MCTCLFPYNVTTIERISSRCITTREIALASLFIARDANISLQNPFSSFAYLKLHYVSVYINVTQRDVRFRFSVNYRGMQREISSFCSSIFLNIYDLICTFENYFIQIYYNFNVYFRLTSESKKTHKGRETFCVFIWLESFGATRYKMN